MPEGDIGAAIYDLGYARYEGRRLGRQAALLELYVQGLRTVFGLGRRPSAKVLPFGLVVVTFLPAVIQLGIAAVASDAFEVFRPENYYFYIQWALVLFTAATATELMGRDRRHRVLPLYFARGLARSDYVLARLGAMTTALLGLTLLPQALLFIGRAFAGNDVMGYVRDNRGDIGPIVATAVALSLYLAALSLVVSAATVRRSFAAGTIIGYFAVAGALGSIAVEFGSGLMARWGLLVSGFHTVRGFTLWVFVVEPERNGALARSGLPLPWYGVALAVVTAGLVVMLFRRYRDMRL